MIAGGCYKTKYGLFPIDEKYCFNCRFHMRWAKDSRLAKCHISGIYTDVTGYCGEWEHIRNRKIC